MSTVPVLVVTGTIGSGKSTIALEMHRALVAMHVPHALIDCDALFSSYQPTGAYNEQVKLKNLAAVWENFATAGVDRLLLAEVIESKDYLKPYQAAVPGSEIVVCRLIASREVCEQRIRSRDRGDALAWHLNRTVELDQIMDANGVGDFSVRNDNRDPSEVAVEILAIAKWTQAQVPGQ